MCVCTCGVSGLRSCVAVLRVFVCLSSLCPCVSGPVRACVLSVVEIWEC